MGWIYLPRQRSDSGERGYLALIADIELLGCSRVVRHRICIWVVDLLRHGLDPSRELAKAAKISASELPPIQPMGKNLQLHGSIAETLCHLQCASQGCARHCHVSLRDHDSERKAGLQLGLDPCSANGAERLDGALGPSRAFRQKDHLIEKAGRSGGEPHSKSSVPCFRESPLQRGAQVAEIRDEVSSILRA